MKGPIRGEYPRPQLARSVWQPLNGEWQFCYDDADEGIAKGYPSGKTELQRTITVPFAYQTAASGIGELDFHEVLWYRREFTLADAMAGGNVLLCFNAVDYEAAVWVNGLLAGTHRGGYTYFEFDITQLLRPEANVVVVRAVDRYDTAQPRGKQYWRETADRCWYHGTSGIWQSVWLERTGTGRLKEALITPDIDENTVTLDLTTGGKCDSAAITIRYGGAAVKRVVTTLDGERTKCVVKLIEEDSIDEVHYWRPDCPNLYDADVEILSGGKVTDTVHTYFGFRKIEARDGKILLNNAPYYQKLVLDQGYWEESGLTPPSVDALRHDIELSQRMGFNGARKHQKVEDPYYYYLADKLGFLVWGEMPSAYCYCADEVENITAQYAALVRQLYNHPSIVAWVPMNESWGVRKLLTDTRQKAFVRSLYYLTKALDMTRPVSSNDGWENVPETDMIGVHDYARLGDEFPEKYLPSATDTVYPMRRRLMGFGERFSGQPLIMTEYGGIALAETAKGDAWGYCGAEQSKEDFYARYASLNRGVFDSPFSGFCYTQLTDVNQEVNGLLDARHAPKFDLEKIAQLNSEEYYREK